MDSERSYIFPALTLLSSIPVPTSILGTTSTILVNIPPAVRNMATDATDA